MKTILKLLLGVIALGLILVIALAFAVATLDPNEHKEWIAAKFKEKTNRELLLEGDLNLTFYPWLGLETHGITVGNAPGFGDQPFFHTDQIKVRIKLLPLLQGQYQIDTIHIQGAVANLVKNKEGITNWDDLVDKDKEKAKIPIPLAAMVLGGVDIQKAKLNWNDQSTDTRYNITQLTVTTGELTYGEPIQLKLIMEGTSNKPDLGVNLNLNGTIAYDLDNERYDIAPLQLNSTLTGKNVPDGKAVATLAANIGVDMASETATVTGLKLDALGTNITGNLNVTHIQSAKPSIQAELKVVGDDLSVPFRVLEKKALAKQIAGLPDRKYTATAALDADLSRGDITVTGLDARLLGAAVSGNLKASNIESATPGFKGALNASGPDLPTLLRVLGQFQRGPGSPLTRYGKAMDQFSDRAFTIKTEFDADLKTGEVDVPVLTANALGARVNGRLKARNTQTPTPSFKGSVDASGPDLSAWLQVAGRAQADKDSPLLHYGQQLSKVSQRAFVIKSDFDADLKKGDIDLPLLNVETLGLKLASNLKAKGLDGGKGSVKGKLNLTGNNLAGVLTALDKKDLAEVLQSVDFNTDINGNGSQIQLAPMSLKATFAGKQIPNSPVDLTLLANTGVDLDKDTLNMDKLSLSGLGLNVTGKLNTTKLRTAPEFSGQISVTPFNLRTFMQQTNQKLPVTADQKVFSKVALDTAFSGSAKHLSTTNLSMVLDETSIKGSASVTDFNNPAIQFQIDIDDINMDRYMPPVEKGKSKKPITPETAAAAAIQLPVEFLRSLNAKSDLKIGKLVFSNAKLANVVLSLNGKDGKVKLDPVTADLYEGRYTGNISIDATGKLPKLTINSTLKGIQMAPLLTDISGEATVSGKGTVNLAVIALGPDGETMKKTLNGQGQVDLEKGILQGVDVRKVLAQVEMMIEDKRIGKVDRGKETPFDKLTATLDINAGIITNKDMVLTAPGFQVNGKGVVANLHNDTLDYDMQVSVVESTATKGEERYNLGGYAIPINCRGRLAAPDCNPDTGGILKAAIQKGLVEKLSESLNKQKTAEQPPPAQPAPTAPAGGEQTTTPPPAQPVDPRKELLKQILEGISR